MSLSQDPRSVSAASGAFAPQRIDDEKYERVVAAVRKGNMEQARQVIAANPVSILKETHEHQKLTTAVLMLASVQSRLAPALASYMQTVERVVNAIGMRHDELGEMKLEDLVKLGEKLRRIIDPGVQIAMAQSKFKDESPAGANGPGGLTMNQLNVFMQAAEKVQAAEAHSEVAPPEEG